MKPGRNAPCPCGSGKKYKKCCLKEEATPSQAVYYKRLSETHDKLIKNLLDCAEKTFGEKGAGLAMAEFLLWPGPEDKISDEILDRMDPLFWPWFLFNWEYDSFLLDVELPGPEEKTVAEIYAEKRGNRLNPLERSLIDAINHKAYSFWEILSVDKGEGVTLQDVLTGARIDVLERLGSHHMKVGHLIYGRAVSVDHVGMIIGLGGTLIPPGHKPAIIELRKRLRHEASIVDDQTLDEWEDDVRELYFAIDDVLHSKPKLCNTDGDPIEFHRLIYYISFPHEAFEALCDLCVTMTPEEMRAGADLDNAGQVVQVEITWGRLGHKMNPGMPNTILGHIKIDGHRLTGEVNSAQRAMTLRHKIESRLGDDCQFKLNEIQDPDSIMNKIAPGPGQMKKSKKHDELMKDPQVREQLAGMMATHWEGWVDHGVPALGGESPREAVKTADGREAVEALLRDAERIEGKDPFMAEANLKGAQRVRELLGLSRDGD